MSTTKTTGNVIETSKDGSVSIKNRETGEIIFESWQKRVPMTDLEQMNNFIDFLKSIFKLEQLKIIYENPSFITADIDCLKDKEKVLTLFITPGDIALATVYKGGHIDDYFAPFDKHISDFKKAKKEVEKIKRDGKFCI